MVGAVPADLAKVATALDGGLYSAFAYFALRGLSASYDLDLSPYLNDRGRAVSDQVETECVFDLLNHAFVKSSTLSADGQPMSALMAVEPFRSIIEAQRIGTIRPTVPVLVTHSAIDDVIPYAVGKQMARSWCGRGANVRFSTNVAPGHVGGIVPQTAEALPFFEARFAGLPQIGNCWLICRAGVQPARPPTSRHGESRRAVGRWAMPRTSAVDRVHEVYATSYRRLVGQLTGVTGDPVEAEDAVMEAFARAVNSGRSFLAADNPEAWLRTVAVNVTRTRWRRGRFFRDVSHRLVAEESYADLPDDRSRCWPRCAGCPRPSGRRSRSTTSRTSRCTRWPRRSARRSAR